MTAIPVAPGELVDTGYLNEVARAHYRKTTAKQVVNSVTETDLLNGEITIGAGAMSTNRMIRLTAAGDMVNNTGGTIATPRIKLKLGATTLLDVGVVAAVWATNAARQGWEISAKIQNLGAANSQWATLLGDFTAFTTAGGNVQFTTGLGWTSAVASSSQWKMIGGNSGAVDTTAAQALALTVSLATANALEDVTLKFASVEIV